MIADANFNVFAYWASILVLKILGMAILIGRWRFTKLIFISPEDAKILRGSRVVNDDPDIERVRRAHLNDLENILPWMISTFFWLTTSPSPWLASLLIKVFALARIVHTIVYAVIVVPQPARGLAYGVGCLITVYQLCSTLRYYA